MDNREVYILTMEENEIDLYLEENKSGGKWTVEKNQM